MGVFIALLNTLSIYLRGAEIKLCTFRYAFLNFDICFVRLYEVLSFVIAIEGTVEINA